MSINVLYIFNPEEQIYECNEILEGESQVLLREKQEHLDQEGKVSMIIQFSEGASVPSYFTGNLTPNMG